MTARMVPCSNPGACGVVSHLFDSKAHRECGTRTHGVAVTGMQVEVPPDETQTKHGNLRERWFHGNGPDGIIRRVTFRSGDVCLSWERDKGPHGISNRVVFAQGGVVDEWGTDTRDDGLVSRMVTPGGLVIESWNPERSVDGLVTGVVETTGEIKFAWRQNTGKGFRVEVFQPGNPVPYRLTGSTS